MSASGEGELFLNIVQDHFLHQHVRQATRGANILDLVVSSEEDLVDDLRIGSTIGGSDHASIEFMLNLTWHEKEENNIGLDYRKADYVSIVREMVGVDWNERFRGKEVNEMWLEFRSIVDELKEKHVPRFTGNRRRKQKWMDYGACKAVKKKYKAWKRFTDTPGYQSYVEFKRARNRATTELRRAKRKFEEKLTEDIKKDSKSFFRYVKSKVGTKEKIGPLKDDSGNVLTDVESMGELLNRFFASVLSKEQGGGDRNVNRTSEDGQAGVGGGDGEGISVLITEVIVREHLAKLGENKAPRTDGMGSSFVKNLVGGIEMPLVLLTRPACQKIRLLNLFRLLGVLLNVSNLT